jgi:hypothetical protein
MAWEFHALIKIFQQAASERRLSGPLQVEDITVLQKKITYPNVRIPWKNPWVHVLMHRPFILLISVLLYAIMLDSSRMPADPKNQPH